MRKLFLPLIIFILFPIISEADTIFFKDGTRLDLKKIWSEDGKIKYEMFGSIYSIDPSEVKKVVKESEQKKIGRKKKNIRGKKLDKAEDVKYLISLENGKLIITDSYDEEDEKIVYYKRGLTIKVPKKAIKEIKEITDNEVAAIEQSEFDNNNKQRGNTDDSLNRIASQSKYRAMRDGLAGSSDFVNQFVQEGMNYEEVIMVAGPPSKVSKSPSFIRSDEVWHYYRKGRILGGKVYFLRGKVIASVRVY